MKNIYLKTKLYTILFIFGGAIYCILELLYSGHTHWSMALCGGASLTFVYYTNSRLFEVSVVKQALICSVFITTCELLCGLFVNILFGMDVWDYSKYNWNFFGQICIPYCALWFVLSFAGLYLCRILKKYLE